MGTVFFPFVGARYYDSDSSRFLSADPLRESGEPTNPQSWNCYAYTLNNPLKFADPDGQSSIVAVAGALIVVVTVAVVLLLPERTRRELFQNTVEIIDRAGEAAANAIDVGRRLLGDLINTVTELVEGPAQSTKTSETIDNFDAGKGRGPIRVDVEVVGTRPGQIQVQRGSGDNQDIRIYDS